MIDRGPDSAGVVKLIRNDHRIICIKGNHEHMAIQSITEDDSVELWQPWIVRWQILLGILRSSSRWRFVRCKAKFPLRHEMVGRSANPNCSR